MEVEYICKHIVKMIQTQVRIYDTDYSFIKIYGTIKEQKDSISQELKNKLFEKTNENYPFICLEKYNIIYASVKTNKYKFILGPIISGKYDKEAEKYLIENNGLENKNFKISQYPLNMFLEEVLLLHNSLNDSYITYDLLIKKNFIDETTILKIEKDICNIQLEYQKNRELHNPYDRELRILDSIKNGDKKKLKQSLDEIFIGKYGTMAKDNLRSHKNVAICHICLSSRAAISGGLLPEIAFSICDSFTIKLEDAKNIGEIDAIEREAHFYYADMVGKNTVNKDEKNALVDQCKNVIFKNMQKKILIKEIAKELYVNPDYLSRIFHQEEGLTIKEYIQKEKILLSEYMLIYSHKSFGEIAEYFSFCSQSHYIKVFKKLRGITPKQFRKKYGIKNNKM